MNAFNSRAINFGIFLLLALLLCNGVITYRAARRFTASGQQVRQTFQSRAALETLLSLIKDAETGQRGYLYTGRESYLEPYNAAMSHLNDAVAGLDSLPESAENIQTVSELRIRVRERLSELNYTIATQQGGDSAAAKAIVESDAGMRSMDEIRANVNKLEAEQGRILVREVKAQQDAGRFLIGSLIFATVTAAIFVVLFGVALNRAFRRNRELQRAEQLAHIGRMAATVAHEVNNPLEAATNLVYLALNHADATPSVKDFLTRADRELARVAHMTRQTLGFYRSSTANEHFELSPLVDEVVGLYENKLNAKGLTMQTQCAAGTGIEANRGEVHQVITNLVANAIDASFPGGALTVGVANNGDGVVITVEDQGTGVPSELQKKIFEPFVTTKKDVGNGLGLWVSKNLVVKHGGNISVQPNTAGKTGTIVTVWLPARSAAAIAISHL